MKAIRQKSESEAYKTLNYSTLYEQTAASSISRNLPIFVDIISGFTMLMIVGSNDGFGLLSILRFK